MAELFGGLTTEKRDDGKLNIVHTDDAGEKYVARVTDTEHVTETDIAELHKADREAYDPHSRSKDFVSALIEKSDAKQNAYQAAMLDDFTEGFEPVTHGALEGRKRSYGSTRLYRQNFPFAEATNG
jgi:hypothetical protein